MRAWKAVSKHATAGTPGSFPPTSSSARSDFGWCRGARSAIASRRRRTVSSITTGSTNSVPPWTMRWPTASIPSSPSRSTSASTTSSPSRTESLRLLDPALTTRILNLVRPDPVAHRGRVLAADARKGAALDTRVLHALPEGGGARAERRDAVDDVHHEMEPIEVVEHDHVERRGRRALFLVAAHVDVPVVRAAIREPVDEPRIAVEGEHDRLVGGEERVELAVGEPVRMLDVGLEAHQVDDIDDAHLQVGKLAAEQVDGGERLQRRHVAAAGHDDVGIAGVVRCPLPDADPARAVEDRVLHGQIVERSEERRVGKSVDRGGRRVIKKK